MVEARSVEWPAPFEHRRMWRLLLAQLHPDAGGDHELFAFVCAVKEKVYGKEHLRREPSDHHKRSSRHFLRTWQDQMRYWASHNRETLHNLDTGTPYRASAGDAFTSYERRARG